MHQLGGARWSIHHLGGNRQVDQGSYSTLRSSRPVLSRENGRPAVLSETGRPGVFKSSHLYPVGQIQFVTLSSFTRKNRSWTAKPSQKINFRLQIIGPRHVLSLYALLMWKLNSEPLIFKSLHPCNLTLSPFPDWKPYHWRRWRTSRWWAREEVGWRGCWWDTRRGGSFRSWSPGEWKTTRCCTHKPQWRRLVAPWVEHCEQQVTVCIYGCEWVKQGWPYG